MARINGSSIHIIGVIEEKKNGREAVSEEIIIEKEN